MKKILGLFLLLALAGCGGGGDGSSTPVATPTPAGTAVSMAAFKSVFLGTSTGATYNFPPSLAQTIKDAHGLVRTLLWPTGQPHLKARMLPRHGLW